VSFTSEQSRNPLGWLSIIAGKYLSRRGREVEPLGSKEGIYTGQMISYCDGSRPTCFMNVAASQ